MKIIFMGSPSFSVFILEALIREGHEVCLAVTMPDKPKGRGKKIQASPVKEAALKNGIPIFQPKSVRTGKCIERLKGYRADVIVVAAFGQILPKEILEMTPYGCVNVHASLLPAYRGAAPVQWAIMLGEKVTGITTMLMDTGVDTGDILMQSEISISNEETAGSLLEKLALLGADLLPRTLKALLDGTVKRIRQPKSSPTPYAKMLNKEMGDIDWNCSAKEIERLIRGLDPWPGAYSYLKGGILKIWKAKAEDRGKNHLILPGTVTSVTKDFIAVRTRNGELLIYEIQAPGKKRMDTASFLRGFKVEAGMVFAPKIPKQEGQDG